MRIIHIVPAITEEASGPSYSVMRLCQSLIEAGEDSTLATLDWSPLPSIPSFVKVFPFGVGPKRLGRSPGMCRWLNRQTASGTVDVLHNHGMWQMNAAYPAWAAKDGKTKLVVAPRGAFSAWAMNHGSRLKRIFWPLIQRPAVLQATCFHATAESEYEDIRRLGFRQPVAIIPNGIDVPEYAPKKLGSSKTILFLGRIHPVKGLDLLLRAWATVMVHFPDWQLSLVGTDTGYGAQGGYLQQLKSLAGKLKLKRIEFAEPSYGTAKLSAYRDANLFVLPSHSENFGVTVAEALAAGTPAIVTKGAPWQGLQTTSSGWWIDIGVDALAASLAEAMAESPDALAQRGLNGREWMIREFSWSQLGQKMLRTYQWLTMGGEQPAWVRLI